MKIKNQNQNQNQNQNEMENQNKNEENTWPFEQIVERLLIDLFHPNWEIRHGACIGLREILRKHGSQAGMQKKGTEKELQTQNSIYIEDIVIRLLSVLVLDRFCDFGADQAVAPVRETCAQTLATILKHTNEKTTAKVIDILIVLTSGENWVSRHASLLSLKYTLSAHPELCEKFFPQLLPVLINGLNDDDDDVRSISSESLLSLVERSSHLFEKDTIQIVNLLWKTLLKLDDLSVSTTGVLKLLTSFYSHPKTQKLLAEAQKKISSHKSKSKSKSKYKSKSKFNEENALDSMHSLISRLFPFSRHPIFSVKLSVIKTLKELLIVSVDIKDWIGQILIDILNSCFTNVLLEEDKEILEISSWVWEFSIFKGRHIIPNLITFPIFQKWCNRIISDEVVSNSQAKSQSSQSIQNNSSQKLSQSNPISISNSNSNYNSNPMNFSCINSNSNNISFDQDFSSFFSFVNSKEIISSSTTSLSSSFFSSSEELHLQKILNSSQLLGKLFSICMLNTKLNSSLSQLFIALLKSPKSMDKMIGAFIIFSSSTFQNQIQKNENLQKEESKLINWKSKWIGTFNPKINQVLIEELNIKKENANYQELMSQFQQIKVNYSSLLKQCQQNGMRNTPSKMMKKDVSLSIIKEFLTENYPQFLKENSRISEYYIDLIEEKKNNLVSLIKEYQKEQSLKHIRVISAISGAIISIGKLPKKRNPIIQNLIREIKTEYNVIYQFKVAHFLTELINQLWIEKNETLIKRILTNICEMACGNRKVTPSFMACLSNPFALLPEVLEDSVKNSNLNSQEIELSEISYRGSCFFLKEIFSDFQSKIFEVAPSLQEFLFSPLNSQTQESLSKINQFSNQKSINLENSEEIQSIINSISVITFLIQFIDLDIQKEFSQILKSLVMFLSCNIPSIRSLASYSISIFSNFIPQEKLVPIIQEILPLLSSQNDIQRLGAAETINNIVSILDIKFVPFISSLAVPILRRMSDHNHAIREVVSNSFALLVRLIPLVATSSHLENSLHIGEEHKFLEQLLDSSKIDHVEIPFKLNLDLRKYQQDGINWLIFLNKFGLHGILCDDMGLGKTLQALCAILIHQNNKSKLLQETKNTEYQPLPSFIVCPSTLVSHWKFEIEKIFPQNLNIQILKFIGNPKERSILLKKIPNSNIVISSYDIVRKDIHYLKKQLFDYLILDEGHIIRNPTTKISQAVKSIKAQHRLILSGTPIQNNVIELWSLFDFLMPGFLGSEKYFKQQFAKPILQLKDPRCSDNIREKGTIAKEALHRQVLPFLLRRMKEDVLKDLPPKIIQDYYCELSPLQMKIYQQFSQKFEKSEIAQLINNREEENNQENLSNSMEIENKKDDKNDDGNDNDNEPQKSGNKKSKNNQHIFQLLQYLRRLCNHPKLVLDPKSKQHAQIIQELKQKGSSINDIKHSPKLLALKQLLIECGIGSDSPEKSKKNLHKQTPKFEPKTNVRIQSIEEFTQIESESLSQTGDSYEKISTFRTEKISKFELTKNKKENKEEKNETKTTSLDAVLSRPVSSHRALIFCQSRSILDIIQDDLLRKEMPEVTFLRLDGEMEPKKRMDVVLKFNNDPTIDLLLLTTKIGGTGLNLTSADTVIFFEHDWNPMQDLQAMDRAHRLGQRLVVNVYRLITKDTLEERIMGLQNFKLSIANSVINKDNSSLQNVDSLQFFNLFSFGNSNLNFLSKNNTQKSNNNNNNNSLAHLSELWNENEYQDEFDLSNFLDKF
ncbi:b-tfiid tata-box-binding protein-associated factor 1 [Anaeramoeba ignava]|uniref:B-tfiid tata-box-binding protein-associated factor 1 n=1 Tax=Anaeramoeba ignava TaxID=1746090 RepID=A0A9Q0LFH0_ANAIG|nr:b-tfiid tata-box-binding protein-associated factor 1 [Anaeramoeba ignava]